MAKKEIFAVDTSQRSIMDWLKAIVVLIAGLVIAHLGVTLFILSEMGSDPFTVFIQGLARTFSLSIGTVHVIVLILLMLIMLVTTKGYVKPGTVVCSFLGGPIIDFFMWLLGDYININSPIVTRTISMVLGCVILAGGMSIVINSQAGTGPNDLIAMVLSDKIQKIDFRWIRSLSDFLFVAAGYLLGGTIGIGTIVAVLLIGPFAQFWLPRTRVLTKFLLKANR